MEGKNPYYEKIKTYIGKQVVAFLKSGGRLEGKLIAVNFSTMNFIIEGKEADYIIRDDSSYISIWREKWVYFQN